jgi:hypothetical protein
MSEGHQDREQATKKSPWQRWRMHWRPISSERLDHELCIFQEKLEALIKKCHDEPGASFPHEWNTHARNCVRLAREALDEQDPDLGWHYLKTAKQFRLYGLKPEELVGVAGPVLAEAEDERKGVTPWRRKGIRQLLADSEGKLLQPLDCEKVVQAVELLDQHHDNTYDKQAIVYRRLKVLSAVSVVPLVAWIALAPRLPSLSAWTEGKGRWGPQLFWLSLVLAGVLGAILSGFTSTIDKDVAKTRIPEELSASVMTSSRLAVGAVSAIAVAVFLGSGLLNLPAPSYEVLLAVALVSGFTDRLLVNAVESTVKAA